MAGGLLSSVQLSLRRRDISPADVQGNNNFGGDFAHLNLFKQRFDEVINQIVQREQESGGS
jgi:hypothetical protein